MVFDAVARHKNGPLTLQDFPGIPRHPLVESISTNTQVNEGDELLNAIFGRFPSLQEIEDFMIERAMKLAEGRLSVAADLLGITRQGLNKRMRRNRK
jgi:transcriptional regulator of acetoin/glycerol metabolism